MSAKLWSLVWELDLGHPESKVLACLCDFAHDVPGEMYIGIRCFPSLAIVAWKTGYDRRRVERVMRELRRTRVIIARCFRIGKSPVEYEIHLENAKQKPAFEGFEQYRKIVAIPPAPVPGGDPAQVPGQTRHIYRVPAPMPPPGTGAVRDPVPVPSGTRHGDRITPYVPLKVPLPLATASSFPSVVEPGNDDAKESGYVALVLEKFGAIPGAKPKNSDERVAREFFRQNIPLGVLEAAFWVGAARRLKTAQTNGQGKPLEPIASLSYFVSIVSEVVASPLPAGYADYCREKVREYQEVS